MFTPALWGWAFVHRYRVVMIVATSALVAGQLLLSVGLFLLKSRHIPMAAGAPIAIGLIIASCSRAGISVLEHSCMALALPSGGGSKASPSPSLEEAHARSTLGAPLLPPAKGSAHAPSHGPGLLSGFCLKVATTHIIGACVVWSAPLILSAYGLTSLQLALIAPASVSVVAALVLTRLLPPPPIPRTLPTPQPRRRHAAPFAVYCTSCGEVVRRPSAYRTMCDKCRERSAVRMRQDGAVLALGVWRATLLGCLHAFNSITVALLVEHGLETASAGQLVALASLTSLLSLPLLSLANRRLSRLLLHVSFAVVLFALALLLAQELGGDDALWTDPFYEPTDRYGRPRPVWHAVHWLLPRVGVFGLALCGVIAPVLPLALVPKILPPSSEGAALGHAYGLLETLSSIGETVITLLIGYARQTGGFRLALRVLFGGILLSWPCACGVRLSIKAAASASARAERPSHAMIAEADASPPREALHAKVHSKYHAGSRLFPVARRDT